MRVPFEWISEFVDVSAAPQAVSEKLTMIGLEVEGEESVEGDIVFEVNVTPNRPDCLSMVGIARELSAALESELKIPPYRIEGEQPVSGFSVEILREDLCNRYAGRLIRDVRIGDSPGWIKGRLEKCGIRSINNIVDVTNYVLLEFGHPLHAFDAEKIMDKKIRVDTAGKNNTIVTLDGIERELREDTLLIWDGARPVAIAGVMGGLNTEVSDATRDVFLESAFFDPASVRKTSRRIGLSSESSYRFERGTDIEFLEKALNRAARLIKEVAGGEICEIVDAYPVKYRTEPVRAKYDRINKTLGTELSKKDILEILKKLCIPAEDGGDFFTVYPPAFRRDIKRDSDVVEEIARIYGYNNIKKTLPRSPLSAGGMNKEAVNVVRLKEAMRKAGFTEVINYSFMNPSSLDLLAIPDTDRRRKTISISNPLSREESTLRTTLLPSLTGNLKYNLDRGIKSVRLFEISRVFGDTGNLLPLEELMLGGIYYEEKAHSLWKEDSRTFYIVKGALEAMFGDLKIKGYAFSPSSQPFLHAGQSADVCVGNSHVGYIGVMGPAIIEKLDLKKQKPEVVIFELNLSSLLTLIPEKLRYHTIPKYPAIERDIAIIVDETILSSHIREMIAAFPSEFIEEVSVFDHYKGGNIPGGKKSLAYSIVYRSAERTLREEEVEEIHSSLVKHIIEKTGGELRG